MSSIIDAFVGEDYRPWFLVRQDCPQPAWMWQGSVPKIEKYLLFILAKKGIYKLKYTYIFQ